MGVMTRWDVWMRVKVLKGQRRAANVSSNVNLASVPAARCFFSLLSRQKAQRCRRFRAGGRESAVKGAGAGLWA